MPGWPIEISGLIQNVLPLIGPGHDPALVEVDGEQKVVASATSGSLATYDVDGSLDRSMNQDRALNLFESAAVGDLTGAGAAQPRQVPGRHRAGRESPARRPERPVQPPDRRMGAGVRPADAGLPDDHRRLPVPVVVDDREGRPRAADEPGHRRHGARAATRLRRRDRAGRRRLPQGHRRLALRTRGTERRRSHGGRHARGLPVRVGERRSAVPARMAVVPPRPAGQRQLRPRRHCAGRGRAIPARAAAGQPLPCPLQLRGRRRDVRDARALRRADRRPGGRPGPGRSGRGRRALRARGHAAERDARQRDSRRSRPTTRRATAASGRRCGSPMRDRPRPATRAAKPNPAAARRRAPTRTRPYPRSTAPAPRSRAAA